MADMSGKYKQRETEKVAADKAAADQENKDKTVVFLSKAEKLRLANFRVEQKDQQGGIIRREDSIKFRNNIFVTDDPEVITFIKGHDGFANGSCEIVSSVEEATRIAAHRRRLKQGFPVAESKMVETDDITHVSEVQPSSSVQQVVGAE